MNERAAFVAGRVDAGPQVFGFAPLSVWQPVAHVNIAAAQTAEAPAGKIQVPFVG